METIPGQSGDRPRVLVADDDPVVRLVATKALEKIGLEVFAAADGAEALEVFSAQHPDIVLLDVVMPELSGFEVCSRIRSANERSQTPVLMITGLDDEESIDQGYEVGATDFATKPVNWVIIGHRIRYMLRASRAADALRVSQERLSQAQGIARVGGWDLNPKTDELHCSEQLRDLLGQGVLPAFTPVESFVRIAHPDDAAAVQTFLSNMSGAQKRPASFKHRIVLPDGSVRWLLHRTAPATSNSVLVSGTIQDVTDEVEMAKQLQQVQKLEALGTLAAGIAHEINNPVGYVSWNLEQLSTCMDDLLSAAETTTASARDALAGDLDPMEGWTRCAELWNRLEKDSVLEDCTDIVSDCREGVTKVGGILQDLKAFSHPAQEQWEPADLQGVLEATLNIAWNELKYSCEVVKDFGEIPAILCHPDRLQQVFLNLLVNAAQAIPEKGTVTVRTRSSESHVTVAIEDTGTGIPDEARDRIFDPFYTTKATGKGTGLGLHISLGIVQGHGGELRVDSTPGEGTTFEVVLPIEPPDARGQTSPDPPPGTAPTPEAAA